MIKFIKLALISAFLIAAAGISVWSQTNPGQFTCATNTFMSSIGFGSVPACTQPSFANLSGTPTTLAGYGITSPLPIAQGGTAGATQQAALNNIAPTPTRAGDIIYYNGTNWVSLAGNTGATQVLQETAAGVPSWATVSGTGTVTSVTCGTGLSGGTFTTSGTCAVSLTNVANSLGADVLLNNTANYFDGPSTAQGTSGTWYASGTVTLIDTAGAATFHCRLWDGVTVIDSGAQSGTLNQNESISLSGIFVSPTANLRISCRDITSTSGKILFNATTNTKDSTLTVIRIQ